MVRSSLLVAAALVALSAAPLGPTAAATPAAAEPAPGAHEPSVDELYDERGRLLPGAAELLDDDGHVTPAAVANPRAKASGMWTSRRPAEGGAYRWRIMAVGVGVLALTGFLLLRFIRRQQPARPARP